MSPMPPRTKAEVMAALDAQVTALLRLEAEEQLRQEAEAGVTEGDEQSPHAYLWYGMDLHQETLAALTLARCKAELRLADAERAEGLALLDGDALAEQEATRTAEEVLAAVEREQWAVEDLITLECDARRTAMIADRADALRTLYTELSRSMPMSAWHPTVPEGLRRWVVRQRKRGAFVEPLYRLYAYLVLRDTIFTGVQMGTVADRVVTRDGALTQVGAPRTKAEERMQRMLDQQFCHPNGDRRQGRETPLLALDDERRSVTRQGHRFTGRVDFEADGEILGLPSLRALTVPELPVCAECGGVIRDLLENRAAPTAAPQWQAVSRCDCTVVPQSPTFPSREELVLHQKRQLSGGAVLTRTAA